jgi:GT2 family glycosyltransferase
VPPVTTLLKPKETGGLQPQPVASVVIISYNTREMLRRCLRSLLDCAHGLAIEVLVVDNASRDGSAAMVAVEFPMIRMIEASANLGFAAANNLAFRATRCPYVVLLNSDAFLQPGMLQRALEHMENDPSIGLGGGRLISEDGAWQPSARLFPSPLNDFLALSGMAHRFASSPFWGRADRTWASPFEAADVDWVPGAFSIIRTEALDAIGAFDERFFLYYEEVDLCRRLKAGGYRIRYWPDVVVVHIGGESSRTMQNVVRSRGGAQLTLWRMRAALLYYRKHHARLAWLPFGIELTWHHLRALRNHLSSRPARREKAIESQRMTALLRQAWAETDGGRRSPNRPW